MTTRPFHNKQEKDRHQQKLTRGCQHWPYSPRATGASLSVRVCEREREADRLLQRLARRCLHCLAFWCLVLLLRIYATAVQLKQLFATALVFRCIHCCLCLNSSHPQRALPALHHDNILHHLAAPVTPPASPFSLASFLLRRPPLIPSSSPLPRLALWTFG
jgi:hypothetical protein